MKFDEFKTAVLTRPEGEEHLALLRHVKKLIDISRGDMAKSYSTWDAHDKAFRSRMEEDREDAEARAKGKPVKSVVPLTFTQIMTFVAFSVQSITQNRRFFELEPVGTQDNPLSEPIELILERDLRRNQWQKFLVQFFLNIGKYSLAAAEVCYEEVIRYMRVEKTETVAGPLGTEVEQTTHNFQPIPVFVGNKIYNVNPYKFFPDTRLKDLSRYQDGEFCGSEDIFSMSSLRGMGEDIVANLDKIPKFSVEDYGSRREKSRIDLGLPDRSNPHLDSGDSDQAQYVQDGPVVVTKIVFDVIPGHFKFGPDDDTMGEEKFPIRCLAWYANDKTIIRFEEAEYLHGKFPYIAAQYLPDAVSCEGGMSLADVCEKISELATWKLNAHITAQRSSLQGKMVIDPAGVDTRRLNTTSPYIYLKQGAALNGVDRYLKQLETKDVTADVMDDIEKLKGLQEAISGWSAQMQGQYSAGRRSATQDRVVAQGAGSRGKTTLGSIWDTAFEPLAQQLLANNRQEMDFDTFNRICGDWQWPENTSGAPTQDPTTGAVKYPRYTTQEIFTMFKADPVAIAMSEDFFVFDGTLPSEKAFLAQSLQEILMTLFQNPEVAIALGYTQEMMQELFNQIYLLRGVTPARLPVSGGTPITLPAPPVAPTGSTPNSGAS